jgi:hypothetical protein
VNLALILGVSEMANEGDEIGVTLVSTPRWKMRGRLSGFICGIGKTYAVSL